jgi:hypothetical protein
MRERKKVLSNEKIAAFSLDDTPLPRPLENWANLSFHTACPQGNLKGASGACKGPSSLTILFLFCDKTHIGSLKQTILFAIPLPLYDAAQYCSHEKECLFSQFLFLL